MTNKCYDELDQIIKTSSLIFNITFHFNTLSITFDQCIFSNSEHSSERGPYILTSDIWAHFTTLMLCTMLPRLLTGPLGESEFGTLEFSSRQIYSNMIRGEIQTTVSTKREKLNHF